LALSPDEWEIIRLSLKVSGVAVALTLPLAFGLAWLLARGRFPGKILLDAVVHLPLVLPPVVIGWLLLIAFGNTGPAGRWFAQWLGLTFMFRWTGAALAAAVMALPLMVRAMRLSIEAIDPRLESAARTLGASRWHVFTSVTLPLAFPGIVAGAVLGFARSIGEFGATITFVSNIPGQTRTLPIAIYSSLQIPGHDATVARLSVIAVLISLAALVASEVVARRAGRGQGSHVL
jgi:molybdate transport system permease protein